MFSYLSPESRVPQTHPMRPIRIMAAIGATLEKGEKMKFITSTLKSIIFAKKYYKVGKKIINDPQFKNAQTINHFEVTKRPLRTDVINFLLSTRQEKTSYLEIGVRNPAHNYNHIIADEKYSVDPGLEYKKNPVDFKMTSDEFYELLSEDTILSSNIRFDVIFIDGLHLAEQVDRDIINAMKFIKTDGFIVLHDCAPTTEWNARETYLYTHTPAGVYWNGTTWKAFLKWRFNPSVHSCCIDSDWGVGILSKTHQIGCSINKENQFFEFSDFIENKKKYLNLMSFDDFKKIFT